MDRILRAALGLILLSFVFLLDGSARWIGLIGAVPLATALIGVCPAYALLGLDTRPPRGR
jgi:hypothetical protein